MNQDQVKELLLRLVDDVEEFSLIFSGKQSRKVNGLYYPDRREIIIHNRNFGDDNALIYTAIHEFAHHVHFTRSPVPVGPKAHTIEFRTILHSLLERAEQLSVYRNVFRINPEFLALTSRIRNEFLTPNGRIMKEFGKILHDAEILCEKHHARFEDYVERVLCMERKTANALMRMHALDIRADVGYENMRMLAGIPDPDTRAEAEHALDAGRSPDMVKAMIRGVPSDDTDPLSELTREKHRIERTIRSLERKLSDVDSRIRSLTVSGEQPVSR